MIHEIAHNDFRVDSRDLVDRIVLSKGKAMVAVLQERLYIFRGPAKHGTISALHDRALNQIRMFDH